ncbi:hypothetical protein HNO89_000891 [Sporosarcina luteola]|nr:hypothetical protein [Sporosarcina luteola]
MTRLPFEPPTDFYHDDMMPIDEQIVNLLKKRKELSGGEPGFPPLTLIQQWSKQFVLYPDYLNHLFSLLMDEETYRPIPEPEKFKKLVPIMKSVELGDVQFSVTFIRQYENSSVLLLHIDYDASNGSSEVDLYRHYALTLSIAPDYYCRQTRGSGSDGHITNVFIISPALPDDLSSLAFVFKGSLVPVRANSEVIEFVIRPGEE